MMPRRIRNPRQALATGIILIVGMIVLSYEVLSPSIPDFFNPGFDAAFDAVRFAILLLLIILGGGGVVLVGVATFFVRRRGFAWGDPFYSEVHPRDTRVTKPSYGVDRPDQDQTKTCPVCEEKVPSGSKVCPKCGELFADLPPE